MRYPKKERRKYVRYDTEAKIYFRINYDLKTKVKFRIVNKDRDRILSKRYSALSRNVSAKGMRFSSDKKLMKGDNLYLEVYLPRQKEPIYMTAEVRWSQIASSYPRDKYKFDIGVKLITVFGKSVSASIYYDKEHRVIWSIVLESIFGNFRKFIQKYG